MEEESGLCGWCHRKFPVKAMERLCTRAVVHRNPNEPQRADSVARYDWFCGPCAEVVRRTTKLLLDSEDAAKKKGGAK